VAFFSLSWSKYLDYGAFSEFLWESRGWARDDGEEKRTTSTKTSRNLCLGEEENKGKGVESKIGREQKERRQEGNPKE
jgi:hypothetical protein